MTATDELRKLLDERGVEWKNETAFMQGQEHLMTTWKSTNGKAVAYSEFEYPHMKKLRIYDCTPEQAIAATLRPREQPPYDELIEALRRDWDIEASWDGLRRFWYVGLTDEGVRKRDEREATLGRGELERENAKLRELCRFVLMFTTMTDGCGDTCPYSCNNCQSECYFRKRARELGVEVDG